MVAASHSTPSVADGDTDPAIARLRGSWTLAQAPAIAAALRDIPGSVRCLDASGVERLDSLGVLQLLRFARRQELDFACFTFRSDHHARSEEHTSELQSLMRISYAVFCLKKKTKHKEQTRLL